MKISTIDGYNVCDFTYDEELGVADSVMSVLTNRGIFDVLRGVAADLYFAGTKGNTISQTLLEKFYEETAKVIKRCEEYGKPEQAPVLFIPDENELCLVAPFENYKGQKTDKAKWYFNERTRAWREVWVNYRRKLASIDDYYAVFPGDVDGMSDHIDKTLQRFFYEVIVSMNTYKVGFNAALVEVMDRCLHADMSKDELCEIQGDYMDDAKIKYAEYKKKPRGYRKASPKLAALREKCTAYLNSKYCSVNVCDNGAGCKPKPATSRFTEKGAMDAAAREKVMYDDYIAASRRNRV